MFSSTVRRLFGASAVLCLVASAAVVGSVVTPAQILALPGPSESTVVTIESVRIVDTRFAIGLDDQVTAGAMPKLTVTGIIDTYIDATSNIVPKQVVPAGATGVLLNFTAAFPAAPGFLSVRTGTATGVPATAGLNFASGAVIANQMTVPLPTTGVNAGQISFYYGTPTPGAKMHVIVDVVGYTTSSGLIELTSRVIALESLVALESSNATGAPGATGVDGVDGVDGAPGAAGVDGVDAGGIDCTNLVPYANLSGCDLTDANLNYADLTGANLTGANLTGAYLYDAYLEFANLKGANLTNADLEFAKLYGAYLFGAHLTDADLTDAGLTDANLTGAYLYGATLIGAHLTGANLTDANLTGANLTRAIFRMTTCPDGLMSTVNAPESCPF